MLVGFRGVWVVEGGTVFGVVDGGAGTSPSHPGPPPEGGWRFYSQGATSQRTMPSVDLGEFVQICFAPPPGGPIVIMPGTSPAFRHSDLIISLSRTLSLALVLNRGNDQECGEEGGEGARAHRFHTSTARAKRKNTAHCGPPTRWLAMRATRRARVYGHLSCRQCRRAPLVPTRAPTTSEPVLSLWHRGGSSSSRPDAAARHAHVHLARTAAVFPLTSARVRSPIHARAAVASLRRRGVACARATPRARATAARSLRPLCARPTTTAVGDDGGVGAGAG